MWPKLGNCSLSMKEDFRILILYKFEQENKCSFDGWCWFRLNNLREALGEALKIYSSVIIRLKAKVIWFWMLIFTLRKIWGEKPVGGELFAHP